MNILVIHEIDWLKKVIYEPHHLAELFSLKGHEVFVIDCREPDIKNLSSGFGTSIISKHSRIYNGASLTIIQPPALLIKGLNRITHFLFCQNVIKKTIIENKIDVILLYSVATNAIQTIKVAKELRIPVILRELDVNHGLVKIPLVRQLAKRSEKFALSNATKVLATTPDLARYVIEMGAKDEKVEYFPLGINFLDFKPLNKDQELAKDLGIRPEDTVIVFIGTVYDFAGLDNIIIKFEVLKSKIKNIKFLIVGGGPDFDRIRSLVTRINLQSEIILTGFKPQKDLPKYLSLADICVNPFLVNYVTNRILPSKILEYFACGKPVLSTPLQGTKELLSHEEVGITYST
ncbi:MAG: glycosyltransferase, partial [Nitrosopumilaceae archaeon]